MFLQEIRDTATQQIAQADGLTEGGRSLERLSIRTLGVTLEELHMGKDVEVKLTGVEARGGIGRLSWMRTREYWEKRPLAILVVLVLTLGSPLIGLFFVGLAGLVVGLVISVLSLALGVVAITKVRECHTSE